LLNVAEMLRYNIWPRVQKYGYCGYKLATTGVVLRHSNLTAAVLLIPFYSKYRRMMTSKTVALSFVKSRLFSEFVVNIV